MMINTGIGHMLLKTKKMIGKTKNYQGKIGNGKTDWFSLVILFYLVGISN